MQKHPHFNLYLHDDEELAAHLGSELLERETLHEWPLSHVERVTTTQGRWIYKSQSGPTVEAQFYATARSDLLGRVQVIYQAEGHACTLREYIDAPLVEDLGLTEAQAAQMARALRRQIDAIEGDLPYMYDIRTPGRWLALAESTLHAVAALIERGIYTATTLDMVQALRRWARSDRAVQAVQRQPGYVHGDLGGDNVFALHDGSYRVIDWQRPFYGLTELDVASLIASLGFDPLRHVAPGVIQVSHFMLIHWVTACAVRWFPAAAPTYDGLTAEGAAAIQSLSQP